MSDMEDLEREFGGEAVRRALDQAEFLGRPFAPTEDPEAPGPLLPLIDIESWKGRSPPLREFAWGDWIPLHQTTMATGEGGVGKSLFSQMLLTCIALGLPFLGKPTVPMRSLYLTAEDDTDELWRRQVAICSSLGIELQSIAGKLDLVSLCGELDTALAIFDANGRPRRTDRWRQVMAAADELEIRAVAFDNATDMMAGDHNDIHQVAAFVNMLTGLAIHRDGVSLIVHHPNKAGDDWLGSIAWHNKVRSRLIIKRGDRDVDPDSRIIENPKANYGPSGGRIEFRWFKGAFVRDEDLPPSMADQLAASAQAAHDNEVFLACLAARNAQKRAVSQFPSATYAPKVFAEMPEAKGVGKKRLTAAMENLYRLGRIEVGELPWQKSRGHAASGLRMTEGGGNG